MELIFDIAGQKCIAESVRMRGHSLMADFDAEAGAAIAAAYDTHQAVAFSGVPDLSVVYAVENYENDAAGCRATFSVHSRTGHVVH